MRKIIYCTLRAVCMLLMITASCLSSAQSVAINTDGSLPSSSAMLDVKSSSKGILIPRTSSSSRLAIVSPAKGLMIYDTTTSSFWYHNGSAWAEIGSGGSSSGWALTGNSGTNPSSNYIGTSDNQALRFRINNTWAGELNPSNRNTSFGLRAGQSMTSGFSNIALGTDALKLTSNRSNLVAIGDSALYNNGVGVTSDFEGSNNTAIGSKTLFSNTIGDDNTAIGFESMYSNVNGYYNTGIGIQCLYFNSSGANNTGIGISALGFNTSGSDNVAIGLIAAQSNETGNNNVGIGNYSLNNVVSGSNNTAVGDNAGPNTSGAAYNNSTAIGSAATTTASNQVRIGDAAVTSIGGQVGWTTISDGRYKTNVKSNVPGLDFILRLKPVTYNLDADKIEQKLRPASLIKTKYGRAERPANSFSQASLQAKSKLVYTGFIAQEVEEAAKKAGFDFSGIDAPKNENDVYGLRYAEFVVPLVKSVQEMNDTIKQQQQMIEDLRKEVDSLKKTQQKKK